VFEREAFWFGEAPPQEDIRLQAPQAAVGSQVLCRERGEFIKGAVGSFLEREPNKLRHIFGRSKRFLTLFCGGFWKKTFFWKFFVNELFC